MGNQQGHDASGAATRPSTADDGQHKHNHHHHHRHHHHHHHHRHHHQQQQQQHRSSREVEGARCRPAAAPPSWPQQEDDETSSAGLPPQDTKAGVGGSYRFWGYAPGRPVLIVPGFMSSALAIQHSELRPGWEGTRAWLDLAALGVQSVKPRRGLFSKLAAAARGRDCGEENDPEEARGDEEEDDDDDDNEEDDDDEYAKKNTWIRHMVMGKDHWRDPSGVRVRPVTGNHGLDGVEFLAEGLASGASWVFAHVVAELKAAGFEPGHDLRAVPYDWRIPPRYLELRDGFFTGMKRTIEEMFRSTGRPVVVLCHSMGCKIAHYFFNWMAFVQREEPEPRAWLHRHIYSFLPVGGPFLGAPKSVRSTLSGDYMGLETFLNFQEALVFGRKIGSPPFMFPSSSLLSSSNTGLESHFFLRRESRLKVQLTGLEGVPRAQHKCYIELTVGPHKLRSRKLQPGSIKWDDARNPHEFVFTLKTDSGEINEELVVDIKSGKGLKDVWPSALHREEAIPINKETFKGLQPNAPARLCINLIPKDSPGPVRLWMEITHVVARSQASIDAGIWGAGLQRDDRHKHPSSGVPTTSAEAPALAVAAARSRLPPVGLEYKGGKGHYSGPNGAEYTPQRTEDMLMADELEDICTDWQKSYGTDPAFGLGGRSEAAPMVPRVYHIYGVNCDTEVGAAYKYRSFRVKERMMNTRIEVDRNARISSARKNGYKISGGIIEETKDTEQVVVGTGEVKKISGDGTVPYASMRHVMTWKEAGVDVECVEMPGCFHRDILGDQKMHKVLLDYVCTKPHLIVSLGSMAVNVASPEKLVMDKASPKDCDISKWKFYLEVSFKGKSFKTNSVKGSEKLEFEKSCFKLGISEAEMGQWRSGSANVSVRLVRTTAAVSVAKNIGLGLFAHSNAVASTSFSPLLLVKADTAEDTAGSAHPSTTDSLEVPLHSSTDLSITDNKLGFRLHMSYDAAAPDTQWCEMPDWPVNSGISQLKPVAMAELGNNDVAYV